MARRQSIHFCRYRITRLSSAGVPVVGASSGYVSDRGISLAYSFQVEAGDNRVLKNGCGSIKARYRGDDLPTGFNLTLALTDLEPRAIEMMTGAAVIMSTGGTPEAVGISFPDGSNTPPVVALEGWTDAWDGDNEGATPYRYVHYVFPFSKWRQGDGTLQDDWDNQSLVGFTRNNPNWPATGAYADQERPVGAAGGWMYGSTIPADSAGALIAVS